MLKKTYTYGEILADAHHQMTTARCNLTTTRENLKESRRILEETYENITETPGLITASLKFLTGLSGDQETSTAVIKAFLKNLTKSEEAIAKSDINLDTAEEALTESFDNMVADSESFTASRETLEAAENMLTAVNRSMTNAINLTITLKGLLKASKKFLNENGKLSFYGRRSIKTESRTKAEEDIFTATLCKLTDFARQTLLLSNYLKETSSTRLIFASGKLKEASGKLKNIYINETENKTNTRLFNFNTASL
ncbi:MAG: hypothetical protein LBJ17_05775 [Dysgonamonadaceae bacterium]|jgi:acetyl/propionyl-CoA carboxylase alpha subunit|nr:hypothetical protein [Dysgonamonadaceae bacterium]